MIQICVRDGNYKLIWGRKSMLSRNYRKIRNRVPEETLELYNLETDPGETTNIASSYPQVVADLKQFGLSNYEKMIPPAMGLHTWVIVSFNAILLKYSRESCSNQTLITAMAATMDGAKLLRIFHVQQVRKIRREIQRNLLAKCQEEKR